MGYRNSSCCHRFSVCCPRPCPTNLQSPHLLAAGGQRKNLPQAWRRVSAGVLTCPYTIYTEFLSFFRWVFRFPGYNPASRMRLTRYEYYIKKSARRNCRAKDTKFKTPPRWHIHRGRRPRWRLSQLVAGRFGCIRFL